MRILGSARLMITGMVVLFVAGVLTSLSYAVIDPETIAAMWLFDESSGQVAHDSSENGNDAEFQGAPEWTDGKFGKALLFDGSTSYLAAPDSDSLDIGVDQLSIVAWINSVTWTTGAHHVVRKLADAGTGKVYFLRIQPDTGRVAIASDGGGSEFNGVTVLPNGEWLHLALVYDGKEMRIYVNGEVDGSAPVSGEITASIGELRMGRGEPAGYFPGGIDEVAIFASALTEEDIQEIMKSGLRKMLLSVEPMGKLPTVWAKVKTAY